MTRTHGDDLVGQMLVRSRPTHSPSAPHPLLAHRQSEVHHAEDLERGQDDERDATTQRVGDQREEEGDDNVEQPQEDVGDGGSLVDQLRREVLRGHHEEQRTGSALEAQNEQQHADDGDSGQSLHEEAE